MFPQGLIAIARGHANDVVGELAAKSAAAGKIHDSYRAFRDRTAQWSRISIKAVLDARDG
jgi:TRAP-type mannitol/chloroaromatic compound transport system substrate-binding protein